MENRIYKNEDFNELFERGSVTMNQTRKNELPAYLESIVFITFLIVTSMIGNIIGNWIFSLLKGR